MTPVKSMTTFPTAIGQAASAGRTAEFPTGGRTTTVEVVPLWAAPWSPAAQATTKR
ncbi:hypothetical protein ACFRAR_26645 [Kitasatospora sp. NPDC056651]|uniref:hypothetical protein n=1 Tax=Kitasatospora sp. NPDC056651 TaxID=3345892 RepID=UPI0036CBC0F6